jgi:hypothetical protein
LQMLTQRETNCMISGMGGTDAWKTVLVNGGGRRCSAGDQNASVGVFVKDVQRRVGVYSFV